MCCEDDDILPSMMTFLIQMIKPFHHLHSSAFLSSLLHGLQAYQCLTDGYRKDAGFIILLKDTYNVDSEEERLLLN